MGVIVGQLKCGLIDRFFIVHALCVVGKHVDDFKVVIAGFFVEGADDFDLRDGVVYGVFEVPPQEVLAVEGAGSDARAQVNSPRHGVKWLALSVAKLTPVE